MLSSISQVILHVWPGGTLAKLCYLHMSRRINQTCIWNLVFGKFCSSVHRNSTQKITNNLCFWAAIGAQFVEHLKCIRMAPNISFCCRDQPEIAELLLSQGAQVNAVNKGGCSSLHVAVNKQHLRCLQSLLSHKANVNIQVSSSLQISSSLSYQQLAPSS